MRIHTWRGEPSKIEIGSADHAASSVSSLNTIIGDQVRRKRRNARLSAAAKAGISTSYLSKIEHGHSLPSLTALRLLADALQIPITALLVTHGEAQQSLAAFDPIEPRQSQPLSPRPTRRG
jgi:transcriptional regulator with XRE-family HTH domain